MDCLAQLWVVQLDGKPVDLHAFVPMERRDLDMRGLAGYLPMAGLAPGRHILSQSHLIGALGPLSRFWSKTTMPAETAAVRKTVPNGAADALPALIVLGLDDSGKAHASWFDAAEADIARSAASFMGMRSLRKSSSRGLPSLVSREEYVFT